MENKEKRRNRKGRKERQRLQLQQQRSDSQRKDNIIRNLLQINQLTANVSEQLLGLSNSQPLRSVQQQPSLPASTSDQHTHQPLLQDTPFGDDLADDLVDDASSSDDKSSTKSIRLPPRTPRRHSTPLQEPSPERYQKVFEGEASPTCSLTGLRTNRNPDPFSLSEGITPQVGPEIPLGDRIFPPEEGFYIPDSPPYVPKTPSPLREPSRREDHQRPLRDPYEGAPFRREDHQRREAPYQDTRRSVPFRRYDQESAPSPTTQNSIHRHPYRPTRRRRPYRGRQH